MRKKLFVCLMLMMCILAQAVPVGATNTLDISSVPVVADDVILIASRDIVLRDGVSTLVGTLGAEKSLTYVGDVSCKAITFVLSENTYYYGVLTTIPDPDDPSEIAYKYSMQSSDSFSEACATASLLSKGDVFSTILSSDAVVVFVDDSGVPLYKCPVDDLSDHGFNPLDAKPAGQPSLKVSEVRKLGSEGKVTGVDLKLDYDLSSVDSGDATLLYVNDIGLFVDILNGGKIGSATFTISSVNLSTYTIYLRTSTGDEYPVEYKPSFELSTKFDSVPAELLGVPHVSVTGLTDGSETLDPPLNITFTSDIPVQILLNGTQVVTDTEFSKTVQCAITENGVYNYVAVTEFGNTVDGSFNISCLRQSTDLSGLDLEMSDGTLVQTGAEKGPNIVVVVLVLVGVALLVAFITFYMKRNKEESL